MRHSVTDCRHRVLQRGTIVLALGLLAHATAAAANAQRTTGVGAPAASARSCAPCLQPLRAGPVATSTTADTTLLDLVQTEFLLSNIYDSNIDQNSNNLGAYGYVPALRTRVVSALDDPMFILNHVIARHEYTKTSRWNRISNAFDLTFEREITDALRVRTIGELSFKGSFEERDLSNQYQLGQEIEYRVTRQHRLILYGTYRYKWLPGADEPNGAFKPNIGLEFQRRMENGERVVFEARYERNLEDIAEDNYSRWNYSAEYRTPITARGLQVQLQTTFRSRLYDEKLVELDDEDFPRHDQQWRMEAAVLQRLSRNVNLAIEYRHDSRDSNDPDKWFDADMLLMSVSYRLWH